MAMAYIFELPDFTVEGRLAAAFQKVGATLPADLQPKAVWPVTGMFMAK